MNKFVANYLQPAHQFVERPPVNRMVATPLCGIASCSMIIALFCVGYFTFQAAHSIIQQTPKSCEIPSKNAKCTETTSYPKSLQIMLSPWHPLDITLHGPSHLSHSHIERAIVGMTCELNSSDGTVVYTTSGSRIPNIFERSCTNQLMPQLTFHSYGTAGRFGNAIDQIRVLKQMRDETHPVRFEFPNDFLIQRVLWPGHGWIGLAGAGLYFDDGLKFDIWSLTHCHDYNLKETVIVRDCARGAPYLGGKVYSHVFPTLCPGNLTDSAQLAYVAYSALISDPSLRSIDPQVSDNKSIMDVFAEDMCDGLSSSGIEFLEELEKENPLSTRTVDELINFIAESIDKQCPYSFVCDQSQFQGPYMWIAIAYPLLLITLKVLNFLLPTAYRLMLKMFLKTQPGKQSNEDTGRHEGAIDRRNAANVATGAPAQGERNSPGISLNETTPADIVEVVNVAVKEAAAKIDQRLINLEIRFERFHAQTVCSEGLEGSSGLEREGAKGAPIEHGDVDDFFNGTSLRSKLDTLLPSSHQLAGINSSIRPSGSRDPEPSLRELLEKMMDACLMQQASRNELNLAVRSCEDKILNLENSLVRLANHGVASPSITSGGDGTIPHGKHEVNGITANTPLSSLPHEVQRHQEKFQQHVQCEASGSLQQPSARIGDHHNEELRLPANIFAPGIHKI